LTAWEYDGNLRQDLLDYFDYMGRGRSNLVTGKGSIFGVRGYIEDCMKWKAWLAFGSGDR
jgi:hypothetical protein